MDNLFINEINNEETYKGLDLLIMSKDSKEVDKMGVAVSNN